MEAEGLAYPVSLSLPGVNLSWDRASFNILAALSLVDCLMPKAMLSVAVNPDQSYCCPRNPVQEERCCDLEGEYLIPHRLASAFTIVLEPRT